jgi:U4/U6 small nuclear ribonucleoprotein PRP31
MDLTLVELEDLLPAATVMVVTVTATTTSGHQLSPALLEKVLQGCAMTFQLDEDKQQVGECATGGSFHVKVNIGLYVISLTDNLIQDEIIKDWAYLIFGKC